MFWDAHGFAFSRRVARALLVSCPLDPKQGRREDRVPDAPEVPRVLKSAHGVDDRYAGHPAFPARWFSRCPSCSPRGALHYCPRRLAAERCACRLAAASPQVLTPEPRAPGPHHFSVRAHPRWVLHGWRALTVKAMRGRCQRRVVPRRSPLTVARPAASSRADAVAATASRPASRDDRETPLVAGGMADIYGKTEFL
jgi:hypothetical protein